MIANMEVPPVMITNGRMSANVVSSVDKAAGEATDMGYPCATQQVALDVLAARSGVRRCA